MLGQIQQTLEEVEIFVYILMTYQDSSRTSYVVNKQHSVNSNIPELPGFVYNLCDCLQQNQCLRCPNLKCQQILSPFQALLKIHDSNINVLIISKQIIKYNRWQQRNGPIIHDVTSAKYNKKNEIYSHQLTCFPRLNKKV